MPTEFTNAYESPASPPVSGSVAAPAPAPAQPSEFPVSVSEFCSRLSEKDRRVELIGAFAVMEKMAGHVRDLPSNFAKRFAEFCVRPV